MRKGEAWEIASEIALREARLREAFPCEECNGTGRESGKDEWYGWNPCEPCYGQGWMIPEDEA